MAVSLPLSLPGAKMNGADPNGGSGKFWAVARNSGCRQGLFLVAPLFARLPGRPERDDTLAESLRLLGKELTGKPRGRFEMRVAPRLDCRRQTRAPRRERLMRGGEIGEHGEILAVSEPVAQPLRFLSPHFGETWPERLDQVELVPMFDHAAAEVVQMFGLRFGPVLRNKLACTPVGHRQSIRDRIEGARASRA